MKKILKIIINSLFLIFGLGVVGFSTYRMVLDTGRTDRDLIDGQEIVVISKNTPVVSTSAANDEISIPIIDSNSLTATLPSNSVSVIPSNATSSAGDGFYCCWIRVQSGYISNRD